MAWSWRSRTALDQWTDPDLWTKVLEHKIIASTLQVLLNALRHAYFHLGTDIGAYHAADKLVYNVIMHEFYDKCASGTCAGTMGVKPFVLGLTVSPIVGENFENAFTCVRISLIQT